MILTMCPLESNVFSSLCCFPVLKALYYLDSDITVMDKNYVMMQHANEALFQMKNDDEDLFRPIMMLFS